jgi:hypothetical protein
MENFPRLDPGLGNYELDLISGNAPHRISEFSNDTTQERRAEKSGLNADYRGEFLEIDTRREKAIFSPQKLCDAAALEMRKLRRSETRSLSCLMTVPAALEPN